MVALLNNVIEFSDRIGSVCQISAGNTKQTFPKTAGTRIKIQTDLSANNKMEFISDKSEVSTQGE